MFRNVIVKKPGKSYVEGLTTSNLGVPDYEKLLEQHQGYIEALKKCNVDVHYLKESEAFPDSTFVEDTAVLTSSFAVITNPGAETRNGEKDLMEPELEKFYTKKYYIKSPGTVEGGDVLQIGNKFYIGVSTRTNQEGAEQLKRILEGENYEAHILTLKEFFHLKTGISYLGNNTVVLAGEYVGHPLFEEYSQIVVPKEDEYSANCIRVNDYVLIPAGYPKTKEKMETSGFLVIELEMSEFQKQDGGLSCLSLRF